MHEGRPAPVIRCLFVDRILTTVESLRAQGIDVLAFLVEAICATAQGRAPPWLRPTTYLPS